MTYIVKIEMKIGGGYEYYVLKSLQKALDVLNYFSVEHPSAGVTEISEALGMNKSNVHDILQTLHANGYIEQNEKTREYSLGYQLTRRSFVYTNTNNASQVIQRYLIIATNQIGEIAYYATIRDNKTLYLGQCIPQNNQWLLTDYGNVTGFSAPLHCTGVGKALLAFQDDDFINSVIDNGLERFTDTTLTTPDGLWKEIYQIRKQGYAVDNMEHVYGVKCVGVPIRNQEGRTVLSISVHGSSVRLDDADIPRIARILTECSHQISREISLPSI